MARGSTKLIGLNETLDALAQLPKATSKNVLKRAGLEVLGRFVSVAESLAPKLTGRLSKSVDASTRVNPQARRLPGAKMTVVLNAGPANGPRQRRRV
jgi:hypothetical protein